MIEDIAISVQASFWGRGGGGEFIGSSLSSGYLNGFNHLLVGFMNIVMKVLVPRQHGIS